MSDKRGELARQFLQQVAPTPGGALESIGAPADQAEALMPTAAAPEWLRPDVESAAEKMARDEELAPHEQFALEAIIIPDKRPAIDIENGDYAVTHRDWLHLNEEAAKQTIRPALPSIGRIELPDHPSLPYGGTGFVVGVGLADDQPPRRRDLLRGPRRARPRLPPGPPRRHRFQARGDRRHPARRGQGA